MEQICRVCLGNSDTLLEIFDQQQNEEENNLAEMLNECAACQIKIDDEFPKMICVNCYQDAVTAFKFKRRYEQSYKLLTMKEEQGELTVDAEDFCDMLAAEEWELPKRDLECIKIELDESPGRVQEEVAESHDLNQESSFLEKLSPPFSGFVETEENSTRYPKRQIVGKSYVDAFKDLESDNSRQTDFSADEDVDCFEPETEIVNKETDLSANEDETCFEPEPQIVHKEIQEESFTELAELPEPVEPGGAHKCTKCPKSFNMAKTLISHLRTHTGERPFSCPYCPKLFTQSHHARDHILIHDGKRPHQCPHCPKAFSQKSNLQAHIHSHSSSGPFKCTYCMKSYCRNYDLKAHMHDHTGDRPHECSQCPKAFNRRRDLERHKRVHTGELPFRCSSCPLGFARKDQLKYHNRGHEIAKFEANQKSQLNNQIT